MIRINDFNFRAKVEAVLLTGGFFLLATAMGFGQQTINLSAGPTSTTLPDGTVVPMWGYSCGAAVTGAGATCAALNPAAAVAGTWTPVVITVPIPASGPTALTINLTNNLSFTPTGTTTQNKVPTSIVILGQVGGGLGNALQRTTTASPSHADAQGCATWFIASSTTPPGTPCTTQGGNIPPVQGNRVQSFSTEVAAGTTASLTWSALAPGTYLLESGTHPSIQVPMGLIGVLVVTTAPSGATAGTAYPGVATGVAATAVPPVTYNAELPLIFSEIDPVQNKAVNAAVNSQGFSETNTKTFGGGVGSIAILNPGSGYTADPTVTFTGGGGSLANATAVVGAVVSRIALAANGGGSGYGSAPLVTVSAGSISTASASAVMAVSSITAPTGTGSKYAVGDRVTFTGGGGNGASGTVATVGPCPAGSTTCTPGAAGAILTVTVTNAGSGYTSAPTAVVGGSGAVLTPALSTTAGSTTTVGSVAVTTAGSGYAAGDIITFSAAPTGGTTATGTVATVNSIGGILTVNFTPGSGYTTPPTVTQIGGTGAVLITAFSVSGITVTSGGSGYSSTPGAVTATIAPPTPPTGYTGPVAAALVGSVATAGTQGAVYSVTLNNSGTGYSSAPSVAIGTGTTTATAVASLSQSCTFTAAGSGVTVAGVANGALAGCYPSAVNYTPFYYLINGVALNKNNAVASLFAAYAGIPGGTPAPATTQITGTILARLVNAGLRMHVPSIVGSLTTGFTSAGSATAPTQGFTLIAEDGNVIPGVAVAGNTTVPAAPRVQTDVFMAPGKTFDVLVNVPATAKTLPIFARDLALSGNSSTRDAGMLAYIGVNGSTLANVGTGLAQGSGLLAAAVARPDTYNGLAPGQTFSVSDVSKGVIANDTNVYGVTLLAAPTNGSLTCNAQFQNPVPGICANGTFTYTPNGTATSDSFTYCANGTVTAGACSGLSTSVTLGASSLLTGAGPSCVAQAYTASTSTYLKVPSPGLLAACSDPNGLPLTVVVPATPTGGVVQDARGGFTVLVTSGTASATINYTVQNSQGRTATGTATVTFPTPSNLVVNVVDAQAYSNCQGDPTCINGIAKISDYRWIIEEDKTFWIDPNCTTNNSTTTPGCPAVVAPGGTVPTFGTNFHSSHMEYVAQGCTGPLSCETGQSMLDTRPGSPTLGSHIPAVCDVGNGACRPDPSCTALPCLTAGGTQVVLPGSVHLDPSKRYYISILPGDAGNPFPSPTFAGNSSAPTNCNSTNGLNGSALNTNCGHTQGGAPIPPACNIFVAGCNTSTAAAFLPVTVKVLPTPLPPAKLAVFVFEDDFPLNGEHDAGGGTGAGTLAPIEPGLGGFEIILWDTFGGTGDFTGQDTHDMFNQPLSNALAGTIDPATGLDACPISTQVTSNAVTPGAAQGSQAGLTGRIVTCPKYESDRATLSPLAGQAVVANLMQDKFSIQAYPAADRIARGEEWLQTNTLDGQHPHDAFLRIGEPSYFQEYGPSGWHVAIGFANPKIINDRYQGVCAGTYGAVGPCNNTIQGQVDVQRLSRTPDQRLYPSGSRDAFAWSQCWVSLGDPDAEDFMFTKCDAQGNFRFTNVPGGNWRLTIGDQWNDQIIDGLSTPADVGCIPQGTATTCTGGLSLLDLGNIGVQQWQSNLYTRLFVDDNKNGIPDPGEIGVPQVYTHVRYRDGHSANVLLTDPTGVANFNETFPLFNWYVVEPDLGRYKRTGTHVVYDAGGPADGTTYCGPSNGARACGTSTGGVYNFLANTHEDIPLPADLSVPGAVYCSTADCAGEAGSFAAGTAIASSSTASTGRIDPPWVSSEAWSGMTSQGNWIEFGVAPFASCPPACVSVPNQVNNATGGTTAGTRNVGENGGIHGHTTYAATRPFDDASQMIEQPWSPNVPNVQVNLYQEGFAADGVTPTLKLVDTTLSTSWDAWSQGFYPNSTATPGTGQTAAQKPYMSCPGQGTYVAGATNPNNDPFFFSLFDQPEYLDWYGSLHGGNTLHTLPYNSQFKCYDAMHIWNQIQPAPYDGYYSFPSSTGIDPTTGRSLGTNCTICVGNPDTTDVYRSGTPMLPPGKYVVEVIMPPGYEVYKEEDKNLLIGDQYIAPAANQFGGLGGQIFIIPDQASVASMYDPSGAGYNPANYQDPTTALGTNQQLALPGFPGFQDPIWPCVGEMRVVPDFLSLFPQNQEVAPFAGANRPLCDRKEVTLADQMSVSAKFYLFTSAHVASHFTGVITNDFTAEFDPFSPQFGEKFSPPNLPVSTRDYLGNEVSRVYADHWGTYEGTTYSTWEVNPPNITGYSPSMMVQCMNDAGPILDTRPTIPDPNNPAASLPNPTQGQMVTDPMYNPAYSQFCYELPYMPGLTTYLDTPVVSTQAFVGAAYNNADCAYPDTTPAIKEVDGTGIGPWVSGAGQPLTITALGDVLVDNSGYAGPSANVAPYNLKKVQRHYGFGAGASVTISGVPQTCSGGDLSLSCTVSTSGGGHTIPACPIQQQQQYGGPGTTGTPALCGQLVVTTANTAAAGQPSNAKQSVDAVTVTIGGKPPVHVSASGSIQAAIDNASPGDLIIVDPTCSTTAGATTACTTPSTTNIHNVASHKEMVIMWKPVRLQGAGAASTIIDANTHPGGKQLDPWRRHVNCLFGLTLDGVPYTSSSGSHPYGGSAGTYSCPPAATDLPAGDNGWNFFQAVPDNPQIDRMPLEATVGWDANLNGNLAELLQEPSLMGAYEGAGITVLAKGVEFHGQIPWSDGTEPGAFPTGTTLLMGVGPDPLRLPTGDANDFCHTVTYAANGTHTVTGSTNPYPSNFTCNPSSIDGLTVANSSQGGGGIFLHGWAHHMQVANNRIYNNAGTLSGGISVGQGEFAGPYPVGGLIAAPGSCSDGTGWATNQHMPDCFQIDVNVHNNFITNNSSMGDELFSATLSGGGGATFCTGNDYYKFNYNWVCGNLSTGEGGGIAHLGETQYGAIEHNSILLNQAINPSIPTNGGGIMVQGTPDTDPVCPGVPDSDCPPGLSDGTGHGLVINANLIQANSADSGSGGGIRMNQVNGTDVATFSDRPNRWNDVRVTNNIIVNNTAGWDGAGISMQDALNVSIINNTIAHNDSLASSGVLTTSVGTPLASAPPTGNCTMPGPTGPDTASCPQVAGVASTLNSTLLSTTFAGIPAAHPLTCPNGQPQPATSTNGSCQDFSDPILSANIIWQNRSFHIGITGPGTGTQNQQNLVGLFNAFTDTAAATQATTGACAGPGTDSYWDIGVRGDTAVGPGTVALHPMYSIMDDTGYDASNLASAPPVSSQYCNGSRIPPECTAANGCGGPNGYGVPPGIADSLAGQPFFSLTPSATVDEGNNWINVNWGPLALTSPAVQGAPAGGATVGNWGGGPALANYNLTAIIDTVPVAQPHADTDFFGNARPEPGRDTMFDPGAVEYLSNNTGTFNLSLTQTSWSPTVGAACGAICTGQIFLLTNTGTVELFINPATITGSANFAAFQSFTCGNAPFTSLQPGDSCLLFVSFGSPTGDLAGAKNATLTVGTFGLTVSAALNGTVTALPRALTLTQVSFPATNRGTVSAAHTVTLTNPAGNSTLTVTVTFGGANPTYFSRPVGAAGGTCGTTLAAGVGSSCTINLVFAPPTAAAGGTTGPKTATLTVGGVSTVTNLHGTAPH